MATQTATTTGKVITNNYYPCMMIAYTPTCKVNCGDGKHTQMNEWMNEWIGGCWFKWLHVANNFTSY